MIKKFVFIVLAVFGFSSVAEMQSGMDHMSDMMSSDMMSGGEAGFSGSVWMKYNVNVDDIGALDAITYRVRLGWTGDVNDVIQWGLGVANDRDGVGFDDPGALTGISLEQAYVSYMPVDNLSITVGKKGWKPNFHKTGILYDEELYPGGVYLSYNQSDGDSMSFYGKLALYQLNDLNGPLAAGTTLKGKLGGSLAVSDGMTGGAYVSATYDGLFKDTEGDAAASTLAMLGVYFSADDMAVPVGAFGVYMSNVDTLGDNHSFTGGVYAGNAGVAAPGEMGDFGVAVSYYDINQADANTDLFNTDYVSAGANAKGIAVRGQYNVWNNTNLVAKFARELGDSETAANNIVAELDFHF